LFILSTLSDIVVKMTIGLKTTLAADEMISFSQPSAALYSFLWAFFWLEGQDALRFVAVKAGVLAQVGFPH
jgi:hypothetical protein